MVWQALVTDLVDSTYGALENLLIRIPVVAVTSAIFSNFSDKMCFIKKM